MQEARKYINEHAMRQRGLITVEDMRTGGIGRNQRGRLEREGTLVRIGRRTYRHGATSLDTRSRLLAGCLDSGGLVACRSGAWLQGISGFRPGSPPDVLVSGAGTSYRTPLARVHTTTWLPKEDITEVDGIPCTSVARTLFGLGALFPRLPLDVVRGAVDDAVRRGIASDPWLWSRLEQWRCRGRNGVTVFEAVLATRAGGAVTESWLEREFLRVLERAGLARPTCQARIQARGTFVARVDFLYGDCLVVIEVTGAIAHSTPTQRAADARRRNDLARAGYWVLEFTYEQVVDQPDRVVADVVGALADRRAA